MEEGTALKTVPCVKDNNIGVVLYGLGEERALLRKKMEHTVAVLQ